MSIRFEYKCNLPSSSFKKIEGNNYCTACQTNIHNLQEKTKAEIKELISIHNGELCGEFFSDQLQDPTPNQPFSFKLAAASIAAFATITVSKVAAQEKVPAQTEQHETDGKLIPRQENHNHQDTCAAVIQGDPLPTTTYKPKKPFMKIGKRHFFTSNKFPFIISRRIVRGRIKFDRKF